MRQHVLDANALYHYLLKTDNGIVARVFREAVPADAAVMMSVVSWGEVYYTLAKRIGMDRARKLLAEVLEKTPLSLVNVERRDAESAAELKNRYQIPYADAFVAALAGSQHIVVTADVKDFSRIPKLRILKLPVVTN